MYFARERRGGLNLPVNGHNGHGSWLATAERCCKSKHNRYWQRCAVQQSNTIAAGSAAEHRQTLLSAAAQACTMKNGTQKMAERVGRCSLVAHKSPVALTAAAPACTKKGGTRKMAERVRRHGHEAPRAPASPSATHSIRTSRCPLYPHLGPSLGRSCLRGRLMSSSVGVWITTDSPAAATPIAPSEMEAAGAASKAA